MTAIGKLTERLTILRAGPDVFDGLQNEPGPLVPLATVWAERRDISDTERTRAGHDGSKKIVRFIIRFREVRNTDELTCRGLHFSVVGLRELPGREFLEITGVGDR